MSGGGTGAALGSAPSLVCHDVLDAASGSFAKLASLIPPLELPPLVGVPGSTAKFANLIVGRAGSSFSELVSPEVFEGSVAKPARRNPEADEESTDSVTTSSSLLFNENGWTVAIFRGGTASRMESRMLVTITEASESGKGDTPGRGSEELKKG